MDINKFKETFDPILKEYITWKIEQAKNLLQDEKINTYIDYIDNFIFSGGKRIRPYCMRLVYRWFGGTLDNDSMKFSIVFELLHSMALIHDDIIDQANKRHNIFTMHKYITSHLWQQKSRIGEWQAMLIWDLIFSWVYELSNKDHNFPINLLNNARENLHSMIEEVILWQMIDVDMMAREQADYELIEKKCYYKTASYTFIRPMLSGAILANADEESKILIRDLWKYLWLAFQLKDDLMDITLWDSTKSLFSDIQEGQQTYFTDYIFTHWTPQQKKLLCNAMGNKLSLEEITNLQYIFQESWSLNAWKELLSEYATKANQIIENIRFKDTIAYHWINQLIKKISEI